MHIHYFLGIYLLYNAVRIFMALLRILTNVCTFFNKMSFISQIYVTWFAKYIRFSKSMQKIWMPTQKNSASWDLQLGFNLAFKRLTQFIFSSRNDDVTLVWLGMVQFSASHMNLRWPHIFKHQIWGKNSCIWVNMVLAIMIPSSCYSFFCEWHYHR